MSDFWKICLTGMLLNAVIWEMIPNDPYGGFDTLWLGFAVLAYGYMGYWLGNRTKLNRKIIPK